MLDTNELYTESAFKEVFKVFYAPLCSFALQLIKDRTESEDLVQEVLTQVWEKGHQFENIKVFRTYLYRSVRNKCYNHLRDNQVREKYVQEFDGDETEESVLHSMVKEEVYRQLMTAIDGLPERCGQIYKLSLEGNKASEIAEMLDLSIETVRTQIKRARKQLKEKLGKVSYLLIIILLSL